jgi:hypothetical protein
MESRREIDRPSDGGAAEQAAPLSARCPLPKVARRVAALTVLFFLIKGLLWLAVPALLVWWRS